MFRAGCWAAALIAASWSISASALGLGEIDVQSKLYQPFRAVIPIIDATSSDLDNLQVRVATDQDFAHQGMSHSDYLSTLQFEIRSDGGAPRILIQSNATEREPILDLVIETRWMGTRFVSSYTLLFDPPQSATESVPVAPPAPSGTTASSSVPTATHKSSTKKPMPAPRPDQSPPPSPPYVKKPKPAPKPAEEAPPPPPPLPHLKKPKPAPKPVDDVPLPPPPVTQVKKSKLPKVIPPPSTSTVAVDLTGAGSYGPIVAGETLWSVAKKVRPSASVSMDQVLLALYTANPKAFAHGMDVVSGSRLTVPVASSMTAVSAADAHAQIAALQHGGAAAPGPGLSTASGDTANDSSLMRAALPLSTPEVAPIAPAAEAPAAASSASEPAPASSIPVPAVAPAAASSVVQPAIAASVASASVASATSTVAPPPAAALPPDADESLPWLWIILGIIVIVLLIFWLLKRRKKDEDDVPEPRSPVPPMRTAPVATGITESTPVVAPESPAVDALEDVAASEEPVDEVPAPAEPSLLQTGFEEADSSTAASHLDWARHGDAQPIEVISDATDPLIEADSHLQYGLYDEAAALLHGAIEVEPERTDLRMKLAETYYKAGEPSKFHEVAEGLQGQISGADWNRLAGWGSELSPEVELFHHRASVETPVTQSALPSASEEVPLFDDKVDSTPGLGTGERLLEPFSSSTEPELDLSAFDLDKPLSAEDEAESHSLDFNLDEFDLGEPKLEPAAELPVDDFSKLEFGESADHPGDQVPEYVHDDLVPTQFGDEVGTKLDLARAYADMGDAEAARALLKEAIASGSEEQKHEAETLLARLGEA